MYRLWLLILFLAFAACSDDEGTSYRTTAASSTSSFTGITATDQSGNLLGPIDSSDWNVNEIFPAAVNDLFNFPDTLSYVNADSSALYVSCYPNPFQNNFILRFDCSNPAVAKIVVIDSLQSVKLRLSYSVATQGQSMYFDFSDTSIHLNELYRIYYRLYDAPGHHFASGHGDILKHL